MPSYAAHLSTPGPFLLAYLFSPSLSATIRHYRAIAL